jgi:hypothetical protein
MENSLPIPTESKELFISVNNFVKDYMSHYDASHDYSHILRVTSNANRILSSELKANPGLQYDLTAIFLSTYVKPLLQLIYSLLRRDCSALYACSRHTEASLGSYMTLATTSTPHQDKRSRTRSQGFCWKEEPVKS